VIRAAGKRARRADCSRPEHGYNARALPSPALLNRRSRAAAAAFCAVAAALFAPSSALAGLFVPRDASGSPNAEGIQTLYLIIFILGMIIFFAVEALLVYTLVKFRWRRGGTPPAQIRGNTPLEMGWTLGAAGILVVITVITFIFLGGIKNPAASKPNGYVAEARESGAQPLNDGAKPDRAKPDGTTQFAALNQADPPGPANEHLVIHVNGQQYLWRFDYPGKTQVFSYHDLVVPTNTTVVLNITSSDVDHSWWIPDMGPKSDAIPSHTNHSWFRISKPGSYFGNCAEFCGENHADMTARVIAVSPDEYRAWLAKQAAELKQSQALLALARKTRGENVP
jgi:cytochrome c oxidase subunit II